MFSLGSDGSLSPPQWRIDFRPVHLTEGPGRFFNQCIQKKGLCDFKDSHVVVVSVQCGEPHDRQATHRTLCSSSLHRTAQCYTPAFWQHIFS